MKVIFIRHGESTGNAGIPSFDLSRIELTATGRAQAAAVAAHWTARPTLIAMSAYLRTHLTAEATIARFADVPTEVLPMEEFTYLEPSRWNGTSRLDRLPHIEAYWQTADPTYCDGSGAESFETLLGRVDDTLKRFASLPADSLVYAFSHGQFMQAVRVALTYSAWTAGQKMAHFWAFNTRHPILNADLLEARHERGRWTTPAVEAPPTGT